LLFLRTRHKAREAYALPESVHKAIAEDYQPRYVVEIVAGSAALIGSLVGLCMSTNHKAAEMLQAEAGFAL
jgi:hypothetical protein